IVAKRLVELFYRQFLIDSLFHADPHPGNFLVQSGPTIVFLDFGAVEPVRPQLKKGMIRFLQGLMSKNDDLAFDGIQEMGFVHPEGNRELLEKTVRHYFNKLVNLKIEDYGNIRVDEVIDKQDYRMVRDNLRELSASIIYPEGYFFIERTLVILFGLIAALDPKVNALELGFPYAMKMILGQIEEDFSARQAASTPAAPSTAVAASATSGTSRG
ncbi:MAG: AarF/ABC1/UbiB kinase family protein, partial [Myxococcales bacterium]|nr:AarF/ABC1/UbiB kinase family protein [Myxococcales bacterium]